MMKNIINKNLLLRLLSVIFLFFTLALFCSISVKAHQEKIPVVISHGLAASKHRPALIYTAGNEEILSYFYTNKNSSFFYNKKYLFDKKYHTISSFNYEDVLIDLGPQGSIPNLFYTTPAQKKDIAQLKDHLSSITSDKIIGFGHSRGAATWLTCLGSYPEETRVVLLILEAPFSLAKNGVFYSFLLRLTDIFKNIIKQIDQIELCEWLFTKIFWFYNLKECQPLEKAGSITPRTPILIVHSQNDLIIPINDSRELYKELRQTGHTVYLFECPRGDHSLILEHEDQDEYVYLVHELYKKYHLPYDERYVNKIKDLARYQPSLEEIDARIALEKQSQANNRLDQVASNDKTLQDHLFAISLLL